MNQYFLGVDGGQSSTTALIGDQLGGVLGVGRAGPCNHVSSAEGQAKFIKVIQECLQAACAHAGLDSSSVKFSSACLGFSGGPADKETLLARMIRSDRMIVTN